MGRLKEIDALLKTYNIVPSAYTAAQNAEAAHENIQYNLRPTTLAKLDSYPPSKRTYPNVSESNAEDSTVETEKRQKISSEMSEFALETDPSKLIQFTSEKLGSEPVTVTLKILNPTAKAIVWKVKSTSNDMFRIHKPVGTLEPQKSKEVRVTYHAGKVIPKDGKHYFVISYITAKDDTPANKSGRQQWADHIGQPESLRRLFVNFKNLSA